MNIFYFSATKGKRTDTLLYNGNYGDKFFFKEDNTDSIASCYNKAIDFATQENCDGLVLCHDDVIIESDLLQKIKQYPKFDVLGVAGSTQCKLAEPALWHIMGGGFQSGNLHGAVAHGNNEQKQMTSFGPYPKRVILLDGVFLYLSRNAYTKVRFDESCPSKFHFYDLNYSLECYNKQLRLGVVDIYITHASPGLREFTEEFNDGQRWFLDKWRGRL